MRSSFKQVNRKPFVSSSLKPISCVRTLFQSAKKKKKKKCILSIDQKYDPTIQLLYKISKEKFENECQAEEDKLDVIKDLCFKGKRQFRKN
jgi:hypothetical protein